MNPTGAVIARVAVASTTFDMAPIACKLSECRPQWQVYSWPDPRCTDAELLVTWNCPQELVPCMKGLRLIHGIAAGADNILPTLDAGDVPVCRVLDASQVAGMIEYVRWSVLYFHRGFDAVLSQQSSRQWRRPEFSRAADLQVGIMGLGEMGGAVARSLASDGYGVRGFSRTLRTIESIECFGEESLAAFLDGLDMLVCLLPLTDSTRGILNLGTFGHMAPRAALVHSGRGDHLVAGDLVAALRSGRLRGAIVDVFPTEPLPPDDLLWTAPGMVVTPHMATRAPPDVIVAQILDNVQRLEAGLPLLRQVDTRRGY